jgi:hypothetical protein
MFYQILIAVCCSRSVAEQNSWHLLKPDKVSPWSVIIAQKAMETQASPLWFWTTPAKSNMMNAIEIYPCKVELDWWNNVLTPTQWWFLSSEWITHYERLKKQTLPLILVWQAEQGGAWNISPAPSQSYMVPIGVCTDKNSISGKSDSVAKIECSS